MEFSARALRASPLDFKRMFWRPTKRSCQHHYKDQNGKSPPWVPHQKHLKKFDDPDYLIRQPLNYQKGFGWPE